MYERGIGPGSRLKQDSRRLTMVNLDVLPKEIWRRIVSDLDADDLFPFAMACKYFKKVVQEEHHVRLSTGFERFHEACESVELSEAYFAWVHETLKKDILEFRIAPDLVNDIKRMLMNVATSRGLVSTLEVFRREGFEINEYASFGAAAGGHIEILRWLRRHGCDLRIWSSRGAAFGGQVRVLKWLISENLAEVDECTCEYAARAGQLEVLKWLRTQGCPWNVYTCDAAANNGQLDVLKWLQQEGSIFSRSRTREAAAFGGHLEVLEWLKSFGISWGRRTCNQAASGGHLKVLQWLKKEGAPWGVSSIYSAAALSGHKSVMEWIVREEGHSSLLHALQYLSENEDSDWTYSDGDYDYDEESYTYSD